MKRFLLTLIALFTMAVLCATAGSVLYSPTEAFRVSWNLSSYTSYSFGFYTKEGNEYVSLSSSGLRLIPELINGELKGKGTLYFGWRIIDPNQESSQNIKVNLSVSDNLTADKKTIPYTVSWNYSSVTTTDKGNTVTWNNSYTTTKTNKSGDIINNIITQREDLYTSSGYLPLNIETDEDLRFKELASYKAELKITIRVEG